MPQDLIFTDTNERFAFSSESIQNAVNIMKRYDVDGTEGLSAEETAAFLRSEELSEALDQFPSDQRRFLSVNLGAVLAYTKDEEYEHAASNLVNSVAGFYRHQGLPVGIEITASTDEQQVVNTLYGALEQNPNARSFVEDYREYKRQQQQIDPHISETEVAGIEPPLNTPDLTTTQSNNRRV